MPQFFKSLGRLGSAFVLSLIFVVSTELLVVYVTFSDPYSLEASYAAPGLSVIFLLAWIGLCVIFYNILGKIQDRKGILYLVLGVLLYSLITVGMVFRPLRQDYKRRQKISYETARSAYNNSQYGFWAMMPEGYTVIENPAGYPKPTLFFHYLNRSDSSNLALTASVTILQNPNLLTPDAWFKFMHIDEGAPYTYKGDNEEVVQYASKGIPAHLSYHFSGNKVFLVTVDNNFFDFHIYNNF